MDENGLIPCMQDAEVEGYRRNLASSQAREDFYEPITHPFPPDSDSDTDMLKSEQQQEPTKVPSTASQLGDTDHSEVRPKRSISQEIINVAYATARDITYKDKPVTTEETVAETDLSSNDSTKSLFGSLILSPSPANSRVGRVVEVAEDQGSIHGEEVLTEPPLRQTASRPRYYSNRATTLPAKLEMKEFDPSKHPKMTRWEIFKRRFYLGAAHSMATHATDPSADTEIPRASTAGPVDTESFCEVTNIEGLDLEGMPPMTQRSRKLFSWTRLKTGFPFKRKSGKGKSEGDPKGEPERKVSSTKVAEDDSDEPQTTSHREDDEEEEVSSVATSKAKPEKDKTHSWFEVLSQRLFTARRHRTVDETAPARPATAAVHPPQYYEIESNW